MQSFSRLASVLSRVVVQDALASPDPYTAMRLALLAHEARQAAKRHTAPTKRKRLRQAKAGGRA